MTRFVEAHRGFINLDLVAFLFRKLVAFLFRKEDGDFVAYSAEGNEIGTVSGPTVDRLISSAMQPSAGDNSRTAASDIELAAQQLKKISLARHRSGGAAR